MHMEVVVLISFIECNRAEQWKGKAAAPGAIYYDPDSADDIDDDDPDEDLDI